MDIDNLSSFKPDISAVSIPFLAEKNITLDVLRLDLLHPHISGNKWYKLHYNITEAVNLGHSGILSFGGGYSNHLHALAYAGYTLGFKTMGILRGENLNTPTLKDCLKWGMELKCISRSEFDEAVNSPQASSHYLPSSDYYLLPMGGDNELGIKGCGDILSTVNTSNYSFISCAVGTGTTLMGIMKTFQGMVIGFMSTSDKEDLQKKIELKTHSKHFVLNDYYRFGGFGKHSDDLLDFMREFKKQQKIELDKVYTAKAMFGLLDLVKMGLIENDNRILFIHTGGLQGNRSLAFT